MKQMQMQMFQIGNLCCEEKNYLIRKCCEADADLLNRNLCCGGKKLLNKKVL